jgi:hypothetical protein
MPGQSKSPRRDIPRPHHPGRPPKPAAAKYHRITIRLHPDALRWAIVEAKRLGIGYQTAINNALLGLAAKTPSFK